MASQEPPDSSRTRAKDESVFQQLENYPWDSDVEFQSGLQAILGTNPSPAQADHLTLRARCFYFARKNSISVDFDAYQIWRGRQASSCSPTNGACSGSEQAPSTEEIDNTSSASRFSRREPSTSIDSIEPPAPYPTSFSQIVELISNGHPIPGIKDVPDTVLEGQASQPSTAKRKKPWERDDVPRAEDAEVLENAS